jgi:hypothetical protein
MFVVWETVDLFASCWPRRKYACGVASANGVECKSGVLYGGSDGTVDGCGTASSLLGDTKCCGEHACVVAWQSGVWVDGDVAEDPEERLLVYDQGLDVGHENLQLLNEVFPLLRDEGYVTWREEDFFAGCGEGRAVCLDAKACVGQDLQAVLCVLVCAGGGSVVLRHPRASKIGDVRRAGGVRTLDGLGDSARKVGEAEAAVATSTRSLDG